MMLKHNPYILILVLLINILCTFFFTGCNNRSTDVVNTGDSEKIGKADGTASPASISEYFSGSITIHWEFNWCENENTPGSTVRMSLSRKYGTAQTIASGLSSA